MSLALFTPILMMRTADVGSYNLGTQHDQTYKTLLNAFSGDWSEYIDKYLIAPIVRYNFGDRAPQARINFVKMGKVNQELLAALLQSLLGKDKIKLDTRELGELAGLSIEEIEQVTGQTEPPAPEEETDPEEEDQTSAVKQLIFKRVRQQIEKSFRAGTFGDSDEFIVSMGYKRQLAGAMRHDGLSGAGERVDDLYEVMDNWIETTGALGKEEFGTPDAFMRFFEAQFTKYLEVFTR